MAEIGIAVAELPLVQYSVQHVVVTGCDVNPDTQPCNVMPHMIPLRLGSVRNEITGKYPKVCAQVRFFLFPGLHERRVQAARPRPGFAVKMTGNEERVHRLDGRLSPNPTGCNGSENDSDSQNTTRPPA